MKSIFFTILLLLIDAAAAIGCAPKLGYQYVEIGGKRPLLCRILSTNGGRKSLVQILKPVGMTMHSRSVMTELKEKRLIPSDSQLREESIEILPKTFRQEAIVRRHDVREGSCMNLVFAKPGVAFRSLQELPGFATR